MCVVACWAGQVRSVGRALRYTNPRVAVNSQASQFHHSSLLSHITSYGFTLREAAAKHRPVTTSTSCQPRTCWVSAGERKSPGSEGRCVQVTSAGRLTCTHHSPTHSPTLTCCPVSCVLQCWRVGTVAAPGIRYLSVVGAACSLCPRSVTEEILRADELAMKVMTYRSSPQTLVLLYRLGVASAKILQ